MAIENMLLNVCKKNADMRCISVENAVGDADYSEFAILSNSYV